MKRVGQAGIPGTQVCTTVKWGFQIICSLFKRFCRSSVLRTAKAENLSIVQIPPRACFSSCPHMCVCGNSRVSPKVTDRAVDPTAPALSVTPPFSSHIHQSSQIWDGHRDCARAANRGQRSSREEVFPGSPAWTGWEEGLVFLSLSPFQHTQQPRVTPAGIPWPSQAQCLEHFHLLGDKSDSQTDVSEWVNAD